MATSTVNTANGSARKGNQATATIVKLTACKVWPEGKLYSSSAAARAVTSGCARNGRARRVCSLRVRYSSHAISPVPSICMAATRPRAPPNAASTTISVYQNPPSPSRLMMPKNPWMPRRLAQWFAARHRRGSKAWSTFHLSSSADGVMTVLPHQGAQQFVEFGSHPVRRALLRHEPRVDAKHQACLHIQAQLVSRRDEGPRIRFGNNEPRDAIGDVLLRRRAIECNHRESGRHGFQHHIAEGLGQARKQEHVGAGVMRRQFLAAPSPGEDHVRKGIRECAALWTVTDHHHACGGHPRLQRAERLQRQAEALFGREPPDAQHHRRVTVNA